MIWEKPYLAHRRIRGAHLLRFIVSKSRSSAVGVSYIRKDHLPDWTQIAHNNTKLTCMVQHRFLYLRRACRDSSIIYLWHGNEQPKICISTSSRGNLVHLRRARCTCKNACTEFRSSRFPLLYEGFHSKIKFTIVFIPIYIVYYRSIFIDWKFSVASLQIEDMFSQPAMFFTCNYYWVYLRLWFNLSAATITSTKYNLRRDGSITFITRISDCSYATTTFIYYYAMMHKLEQ